jgi:NAD(P)-dependent dehydrogenase (short-subunit alcohol dehydrogenase family)
VSNLGACGPEHGGAGSIGGAVARAFGHEGARVFLAFGGPGSFSGPFVDSPQALAVLAAFAALSALLLRRRDVA